jgi:hypothetical protein
MASVKIPPEVAEALERVPIEALASYAELLTALELDRWFIDSRGDAPPGNMRTRAFGTAGMLTYFVLEETREVVLVQLVWAS